MTERIKKCTKCRETKSVEQFSKDKSRRDGFQDQCKTCCKDYRQSKKGKQARSRYLKSEKGKRSIQQYNQSEKRKQSARQYGRSEKGRQSQKRFRQSEKGQQSRRKDNVIRRTNESQSGGFYTPFEWHNLCKFYNFYCLRCNRQFLFEKLTIDHIKPVSKGGSSFIFNIQPLCNRCNNSKGDKEIDYRPTLPDWIERGGPVWIQDSLFEEKYGEKSRTR